MNSFRFLLLSLLVIGIVNAQDKNAEDSEFEKRASAEYAKFRQQYGKSLSMGGEDRFKIFKNNLKEIETFNKDPDHHFQLGVGPYADLTNTEYVETVLNVNMINEVQQVINNTKNSRTKRQAGSKGTCPPRFMWEDISVFKKNWNWYMYPGYSTPVRNQGQCASCYTFATADVFTTRHKFMYSRTNEQQSGSQEQILDLSMGYGNLGCRGGFWENSYKYLLDKGLVDYSVYPYQGDTSQSKPWVETDETINKWKVNKDLCTICTITSGNEADLWYAQFSGAVGVAIDASTTAFQNYKGGIFDDVTCSKKQPNHAMVAIGYGYDEAARTYYWLVKNSYGTGWGENGFIRIKYGKNVCGIAGFASYPSCYV